MWYLYFILLIWVIVIIRLVLIATGSMEARDKVSKASNWLIGLVMISIAWAVLGKITGSYIGKFSDLNAATSKQTDTKTGGYFQQADKNKTTYDADTVKVNIRLND